MLFRSAAFTILQPGDFKAGAALACRNQQAGGRLQNGAVGVAQRDVSYYQPVKDCTIEQVRQHPQWRQYASQLRYGHFEVSKDFFLYVFDQMKVDRPINN